MSYVYKQVGPRCFNPLNDESCFRIQFEDGTKAYMYGEGVWWNGSQATCDGVLIDFAKPICEIVEVAGKED